MKQSNSKRFMTAVSKYAILVTNYEIRSRIRCKTLSHITASTPS